MKHIMRGIFLHFVFLGVLFAAGASSAENYEPAFLNGDGPLTFQQDRRLRVDIETSVEIVLSAPLDQVSKGPIPLIALEGQGGITLWMKNDRTGIAFGEDGGGPGQFANVNLGSGDYNHVILHVRGPLASVTVNGLVVIPWARFDFQATDQNGLSLSIGGLATQNPASDASFRGWIRTVRVWHSYLSAYKWTDLRRARAFPPESNFFNTRDLVLYTRFTDAEQAVYYTDPEIFLDMMETGAEGTSYFLPLGKRAGYKLSGFFSAKAKQGRPRFSDFAFAYAITPSIVHRDRRGVALYPRTTPVQPIADAWLTLLNGNDDGIVDYADMLKLQIPKLPDGVKGDTSSSSGGEGLEGVGGLIGRHDGTHVTELTLVSGVGLGQPDPYGDTTLHDSFDITLPIGAILEGFVVKKGEKGLVGIGIAFSEAPADLEEQRLRNLLARPLVALNTSQPGRKSLNIADTDHGTFNNQEVHVLRRWRGIPGIALLTDNGGPEILMQHYLPKGEGLYEPVAADSIFRSMEQKLGVLKLRGYEKGKADASLFVQDGVVTVNLPGKGRLDAKVVLLPPDGYSASGPDKLPWGATFALEQRATRTRANFAGYNIFEIDTHDYQSSIGAFRNVFAYPDDNSKDYSGSDSKLIYPYGVFLDSDAAGNEGGQTSVVSTAFEYTQHWAYQLGGNIGIPLIASFSASGSHSKRMEFAFKGSTKHGIAKTYATHYGLVLDKGRIRLDHDFMAKVYDLRNRYLTSAQKEDNLDIVEPVKAVVAEVKPYYDAYISSYHPGQYLKPGVFKEFRQYLRANTAKKAHASKTGGELGAWIEDFFEKSKEAVDAVDRVVAVLAELPFPETQVFQQFGTHYPYAVTYGGMAFAETSEFDVSVSNSTSVESKVKASASGVLEDIQVGVSGGREWGSSTKSSYSNESGSTFYDTYGGSMSRGGGWSLGRGEEVPLLLDLRPLHELLSPIYFDDPVIWGILRHRLAKVLELEAVKNSPGALREALNEAN